MRSNIRTVPDERRAPVEPGIQVEHSTWGRGIVLEADPHQLLVVFDTVGYRHLTPAALTAGLLHVVPSE